MIKIDEKGDSSNSPTRKVKSSHRSTTSTTAAVIDAAFAAQASADFRRLKVFHFPTFFRLFHKSAFSDCLNIADITYIELFLSSLWAFPLIISWMRSYLMHIISSQFLTMLFGLFLGIYRCTNHVLVSSIFHLWVKFKNAGLLCI